MNLKLIKLEIKMDRLFERYLIELNENKIKKLYSKMLFISMEIKDEKDKLDLNYD